MPAHQVVPVRLDVRDLRPRADGPLSRREPGLHRRDDPGGDLVLNREDVFGVPVEALRPELEAARDVGQLRGDAEPIARRPYACLLYTSDAADEEDSVDLG